MSPSLPAVSLTDRYAVAGQLLPEHMGAAAAAGFGLVINNRPDGEEPGQPASLAMAAACAGASLAYHHIPIAGHLTADMIEATRLAMAEAGDAPVLAFCRSGNRSTLLWACAQAANGKALDKLAQLAARAGYSLAPVMPIMEQLAKKGLK